MIPNPIYERERRTAARSIRFPMILFIFNAVILAAALLFLALSFHTAQEKGSLRYTEFLSCFRMLFLLEYAMSMVMMPALTAGSITGERERKTLELVFTTPMSAEAIVLGKLCAALSSVLLIALSGLPVFLLVLLFGGVRIREVAALLFLLAVSAFLEGALGIFFSSVSRSTATAMAAAYSGMLLLFLLPFGLLRLTEAALGGAVIFLSPAASFYAVLRDLTGEKLLMPAAAPGLQYPGEHGSLLASALMAAFSYLAAAGLLLFAAAQRLRSRTV